LFVKAQQGVQIYIFFLLVLELGAPQLHGALLLQVLGVPKSAAELKRLLFCFHMGMTIESQYSISKDSAFKIKV
jgi:hypothetical protein